VRRLPPLLRRRVRAPLIEFETCDGGIHVLGSLRVAEPDLLRGRDRDGHLVALRRSAIVRGLIIQDSRWPE
jgi:hypothetical protein